jgi:DNA-binding MarR family transcriptional regulator
MSTDIPVLEISLAYRVHRAARLLRQGFLRLASDVGLELTPEQWFVLNKLRHQDGRSQVELCDELLDDRPNLTRILTGLEQRGLVRRTDDPQDARRKLVHLTEEGRALHDSFTTTVHETRAELLGDLDPDDLAVVFRVLDQLEGRLQR